MDLRVNKYKKTSVCFSFGLYFEVSTFTILHSNSLGDFFEDNAGILARGWCSKMQWLKNLSNLPFAEQAAMVQTGWVEPSEFTTMVNANLGHRLIQVRGAHVRGLSL